MPQLGETVTEGTVITWAKRVGDQVAVDDTLFEVSTEKIDTEVPSAVAGFLRAVLVEEGDTVAVGTPMAVITATADEPLVLPEAPMPRPDRSVARGDDGTPGSPRVPHGAVPATVGDHRSSARSPSGSGSIGGPGPTGGSTVLSPVVRRLLAEHDLTTDDVVGSGRDGRITRADVLAARAQRSRVVPVARGDPGPADDDGTATASPGPAVVDRRPDGHREPPVVVKPLDDVVELSRARLATADRLVSSLATAAHALVVVRVDYHRVDQVRRPAGLHHLPFVARALVDAVADFPHVNAGLDGDRLVVHRSVDLGVAVDLDGEALVVPVVHDAGSLRLAALSERVADLADRARRHRLTGDDLVGASITVTNVGSLGTFATAPIIDRPQVAICSTDGVAMAPVAVRTDDRRPGTEPAWGVAVHPVGNLSLSFDHRAFDGAYAAGFLDRVRTILETRDWHRELTA